ncbi:glutaminase A [Clostridium sp. Ade.TY]|uniref:glutaminase A n=1 Tax=Clostridium sp. Ade.TY TaxID=1391647 RepID=UPI000400D410|nr:glutaminase A [Clostridium sp. Ade.TY]
MTDMLQILVDKNKIYGQDGKLASYIPALLKADVNDLGIAVVELDGKESFAGNCDKNFTIQSISKIVSLMIALSDNEMIDVFKKVNVEPTGEGFNSIVKLETTETGRPYNPMINAGAIVTTSLIKGETEEGKLKKLIDFMKKATNNPNIKINEEVYISEKLTGNRNRALAYFMKSSGILEGNVEEILDLYFRQCSIEANAKDLARLGAVLANDGIIPWSGEKLIDKHICRIVKSIMVTCGMYDASGEFAVRIGIPAKSGVGGGIVGAVPKRMGIGVYGPALDEKGNSIAGLKILEDLANKLDLSIF